MTQSILNPDIARYTRNSVRAALNQDPARPSEDRAAEEHAALAMLDELGPQTATEAALASRAVIAHHASAECFRRAVQPDITPALQSRLISNAMALSRLSSQLTKALAQTQAEAFAMPGGDVLAAFGKFNPIQAGEHASNPAGEPRCRPGRPPGPADAGDHGRRRLRRREFRRRIATGTAGPAQTHLAMPAPSDHRTQSFDQPDSHRNTNRSWSGCSASIRACASPAGG